MSRVSLNYVSSNLKGFNVCLCLIVNTNIDNIHPNKELKPQNAEL